MPRWTTPRHGPSSRRSSSSTTTTGAAGWATAAATSRTGSASSPLRSPGASMTDELAIPRRLVAGDPGWITSADVVVVGSGIAGLTTALRLRQRVDRVLLVTKTVLNEGSTQWAQGGIAAALDPGGAPAGPPQ